MAETSENQTAGKKPSGKETAPVRIKKYANRRLYNTASSSYVTLDYLAQMVRDGVDFIVEDAKTGEDITRSVLTQIIVEEEAKGQTMLPINFLRQLISLYGDNLQSLVPRYLEESMDSFTRNQEKIRQYMKESLGGMFPVDSFKEMSRQNMAFFEQAMRLWSPFAASDAPKEDDQGPEAGGAEPGEGSRASTKAEDLDNLREKMREIQDQLDAMTQATARQIKNKN